VAVIPSRRRFRSSATDAILVRPTRLVTVGDRAFPVAAAKLWHELPGDVTASLSLAAFRRQLETFLFRLSYPVLYSVLLGIYAIAVCTLALTLTLPL